MAKATIENTTSIDPARRRFLTVAAAASAVSATALASAAMPAHRACTAPLDDSELVKLEGQIFEQHEGAVAFDDELIRLSEIWTTESKRLYEESLSSCPALTPQERWTLVTDIPECREHSRLCRLQEPFLTRMDALVKEMFATPAHTAEGRRAKVTVLLGCVLGDDWRRRDEETEYPERMARTMLIDLVGGEPGEMLRGQFA